MSKEKKGLKKQWSPAEVSQLRRYAEQKLSARVVSQKLGRSVYAVRAKALGEKISFQSVRSQKGK